MNISGNICRSPWIKQTKEQTHLNNANYHKAYLLLIQCNKECLWAKTIDFIHSKKLADSAVDDKVCIEQI